MGITRRSLIKAGFVAVASGSIIGIIATQRPYTNKVTIGLAPTTQSYIKGQPKIEEGQGEVWAVLFKDADEMKEKLHFGGIPPRVQKQISAGDDGFWVMGASVLPSGAEFNLVSSSMSIDGGVVRYQATQSQSMSTSDEDLLYHYELEKWSPKFPMIGSPDEVQVEWKSNLSGN